MKKKILVIRYRFIGDTVLTVPFLRNLRRAYPDAQIDMVVGPVSGDVLLDCPYIDNLIVFDTTKKHKYENTGEQKKNFFSYVKLFRENKYHKAYVLKRSLSSAVLAFLSGIPQRIGFDTEGRGLLLTKRVPYVKEDHEVQSFLDVLRADDIPVEDNYLEGWVNVKSESKIQDILKNYNLEGKKKVLVHATSGNEKKQWPYEYFARVIEYLSNEKNSAVFFTGTKKDAEVYNEILNLVKNSLNSPAVNLCGELSIQDSTALINKMDYALGCDSGTLHIAASLNIPVIGLYGPMNYKKWHAWGDIHKPLHLDLPCMPCELRIKCDKNYACIRDITPEMVINQINSLE